VVAEWIESPDALKLLKEMGAQYGQGYLFSKPVPLAQTIHVPAARQLRARARA
jgi:EAL domain-containing protein (putative c-di-GMP-specific phosphodiesterase class I)